MTKINFFLIKTSNGGIFLGNNIDVDPNIVCHTEQSEVSILNAVFRSFTFVQDDKFAKKKVAGQLLYYCHILFQPPHARGHIQERGNGNVYNNR